MHLFLEYFVFYTKKSKPIALLPISTARESKKVSTIYFGFGFSLFIKSGESLPEMNFILEKLKNCQGDTKISKKFILETLPMKIRRVSTKNQIIPEEPLKKPIG